MPFSVKTTSVRVFQHEQDALEYAEQRARHLGMDFRPADSAMVKQATLDDEEGEIVAFCDNDTREVSHWDEVRIINS